MDSEINSDPELENELKYDRFAPRNIVCKLIGRETFSVRSNINYYYNSRYLYQNIVPNLSIACVEKPSCFLRKFTPDGRHLIAFSGDQTSVEIYQYNGASAANELIESVSPDCDFIPYISRPDSRSVRSNIFSRLFKLKHSINVATNGEQLNRECSLFVSCSRLETTWENDRNVRRVRNHNYLIVGSAQVCTDYNFPHYHEIYRNNESISLSARSALEDYTIYLIDIERGKLTDKREFKVDKIFLAHNQGVYIHQHTMAVLSIQHQTIHIFEIVFTEHGASFVEMKSVGRFCFEDDEDLINAAYTGSRSANVPPFRETAIAALKHRVLAFLFRKAQSQCRGVDVTPLLEFTQQFDRYLNLRMWKMQLLDSQHFLIKFTHEDVITLRVSDMNSLPTLHVLYNHVTGEVLDVFMNHDERLLDLYEKFCDQFRNISNSHRVFHNFGALRSLTLSRRRAAEQPSISYQPVVAQDNNEDNGGDTSRIFIDHSFQYVSSLCNNVFARAFYYRTKNHILNSRNSANQEIVKRILSQLPISAQSFSCSPYLDLSLFSYDEKLISPFERPKQSGEYAIRFYDRSRGQISFQICPGFMEQLYNTLVQRKLVAFIFHPYDPFIISIQRINQEYTVNFHIRRSET